MPEIIETVAAVLPDLVRTVAALAKAGHDAASITRILSSAPEVAAAHVAFKTEIDALYPRGDGDG